MFVEKVEVLYWPFSPFSTIAGPGDLDMIESSLTKLNEKRGRFYVSQKKRAQVLYWKAPMFRNTLNDLKITVTAKDYLDWSLVKLRHDASSNEYYFDTSDLMTNSLSPINIRGDLEKKVVFDYITLEYGHYVFFNEKTKRAIAFILKEWEDDEGKDEYPIIYHIDNNLSKECPSCGNKLSVFSLPMVFGDDTGYVCLRCHFKGYHGDFATKHRIHGE